jgi:hypothetical protein
VFGIVADAHM